MYTQPFRAPTATCVPPVPSRLLPTADPENTSLVAGGGGKLIGDDDPDTGVRVMPPTAASRAAARLEAGAAPAEETRSAILRTSTNSRREDSARCGLAACVVPRARRHVGRPAMSGASCPGLVLSSAS